MRPFSTASLILIFLSTISSIPPEGDANHIDPLKAKILFEMGIVDPALYSRYDVVWPRQNPTAARTKRESFLFASNNDILYIAMDLFGKRTLVVLEMKNITSPIGFETILLSAAGVPYVLGINPDGLNCHYRGKSEVCVAGKCRAGSAAVSACSDDGRLSGYLKLEGDDVQLRPLPETVTALIQEAQGAHLAKKLDPLEQWDELRELGSDFVVQPWRLPTILDNSQFFQKLRERYGHFDANDLALPPNIFPIADDIIVTPKDSRLVLEIAVFVDQPMATKLQQDYSNSQDQINAILAAFNAVQVIFDDDSFGNPKVRILVKRVIIDQTGKVFKGGGEAEAFLKDLCDYQDQLVKSLGKHDWTLLVALTGIDIFGVLTDVVKDSAYSNLRFSDSRVHGVTGLTFTGQACRPRRNCVVAEFWKEMGNVDTIAHEIGHTLGMNHDGTSNTCNSRSGALMSLSTTTQRSGWSTCSVKSFHDFLSQGKGSCLLPDNGATPFPLTNG